MKQRWIPDVYVPQDMPDAGAVVKAVVQNCNPRMGIFFKLSCGSSSLDGLVQCPEVSWEVKFLLKRVRGRSDADRLISDALNKQCVPGDVVFVRIISYVEKKGRTKAVLSMIDVDQRSGDTLSRDKSRTAQERAEQTPAHCWQGPAHSKRTCSRDTTPQRPSESSKEKVAGEFIRKHEISTCTEKSSSRSRDRGTTKVPELHSIHKANVTACVSDGAVVKLHGGYTVDVLVHHSHISRLLDIDSSLPDAERREQIQDLLGDVEFDVWVKITYVGSRHLDGSLIMVSQKNGMDLDPDKRMWLEYMHSRVQRVGRSNACMQTQVDHAEQLLRLSDSSSPTCENASPSSEPRLLPPIRTRTHAEDALLSGTVERGRPVERGRRAGLESDAAPLPSRHEVTRDVGQSGNRGGARGGYRCSLPEPPAHDLRTARHKASARSSGGVYGVYDTPIEDNRRRQSLQSTDGGDRGKHSRRQFGAEADGDDVKDTCKRRRVEEPERTAQRSTDRSRSSMDATATARHSTWHAPREAEREVATGTPIMCTQPTERDRSPTVGGYRNLPSIDTTLSSMFAPVDTYHTPSISNGSLPGPPSRVQYRSNEARGSYACGAGARSSGYQRHGATDSEDEREERQFTTRERRGTPGAGGLGRRGSGGFVAERPHVVASQERERLHAPRRLPHSASELSEFSERDVFQDPAMRDKFNEAVDARVRERLQAIVSRELFGALGSLS